METIILKIILSSLDELANDFENENLLKSHIDTALFGKGGNLESIELVALIADVEEKIFDEFDVDIILADEKAMSQANSPFLTVKTLVEYIKILLPVS